MSGPRGGRCGTAAGSIAPCYSLLFLVIPCCSLLFPVPSNSSCSADSWHNVAPLSTSRSSPGAGAPLPLRSCSLPCSPPWAGHPGLAVPSQGTATPAARPSPTGTPIGVSQTCPLTCCPCPEPAQPCSHPAPLLLQVCHRSLGTHKIQEGTLPEPLWALPARSSERGPGLPSPSPLLSGTEASGREKSSFS